MAPRLSQTSSMQSGVFIVMEIMYDSGRMALRWFWEGMGSPYFWGNKNMY